MPRQSFFVRVTCLKVISQGAVLGRKAVWLAGMVSVALVVPCAAGAGGGFLHQDVGWRCGRHLGDCSELVACKCADLTDVTCIASGDTVNVTENASQTGSLVDAGTLSIPSGSLEIVSTVEASSVANVSIVHGTLINAGILAVSSTFTGGEGGVLKGLGTTLIESGAKATVTEVGTLFVEEQTFENTGTLTVGKKARFQAARKCCWQTAAR
jgi:hypothetical protein